MGILFFTHIAHAQSIDRQTDGGTISNNQGTNDYFYNQSISVFDATVTALNTVNSSYQNITNQSERTRREQALRKNIEAVNAIRNIYTTEFNRVKLEPGTTPAKTQISALNRTIGAFSTQFTGIERFAEQQAIITGTNGGGGALRNFNSLLTQARQIDSGQIAAGSPQANSLVNAEAVTRSGESVAAVVNNAATSKCTIWNWTIIGCIDAGVAWFIKNTLLQVAGVLVWLSANMLNFAVQASVLDFAKWSPESLYPIWVVIRQIVSLAVVFAGLYLGFLYIVGREATFGKYMAWLIIFALFVNFSYPVARAMTDLSNIVALKVYTAAVGPEALATDFSSTAMTAGTNTPGSLIMNRLGLQGMIGSASTVETAQAGFISNLNSTPNALIAVAFVFYSAYVLFMATALLIMRTVILSFLIVASPLLLIDSVVPKLGDQAMKLRKLFFENLLVAPVFMVMLALTLKFMEVFTTNGKLVSGAQSALTTGTSTIQTFFSITMMLIMLHITLKVTKSFAGEMGERATNFMGKVGGFGLAVASGGTGLLARGTIGAAASRFSKSPWMDKMKDTRSGRMLGSLTNSLAQSTYDPRNIGMVGKGLASAGMTGGFGVTMQKGLAQNFEERKQAREDEVVKMGASIKDDTTRANYFKNANTGLNRLSPRVNEAKLRETNRDIEEKRKSQMMTLVTTTDPEKRKSMLDQANISRDYVLEEKLKAAEEYLSINNTSPTSPNAKAEVLRKLKDDKAALKVIEGDPYTDLKKELDKKIEALEEEKGTLDKSVATDKTKYEKLNSQIGILKKDHNDRVKMLRSELQKIYSGNLINQIQEQDQVQERVQSTVIDEYQIPAYARKAVANQGPQLPISGSGPSQAPPGPQATLVPRPPSPPPTPQTPSAAPAPASQNPVQNSSPTPTTAPLVRTPSGGSETETMNYDIPAYQRAGTNLEDILAGRASFGQRARNSGQPNPPATPQNTQGNPRTATL